MPVTYSRQLPDGEELVWAEALEIPGNVLDPRDSARVRRQVALDEGPLAVPEPASAHSHAPEQ